METIKKIKKIKKTKKIKKIKKIKKTKRVVTVGKDIMNTVRDQVHRHFRN